MSNSAPCLVNQRVPSCTTRSSNNLQIPRAKDKREYQITCFAWRKGARYKECDAKRNDSLRMRWFVELLVQTGRAVGGGLQRDYTPVFLNTVVKDITEEDRKVCIKDVWLGMQKE